MSEKKSAKPIIYTKHDSITVEFGAGRMLRMGRYADSAKGNVPKTVFFAWVKVRDAKGGTLGERVEKFVKNIRRIWPGWDKAGVPKPRKATAKSLADKYGRDAIRALQNGMTDAAERQELPSRFMQKNGPRGNCVILLDTETGKSIEVSLCDLFGARQALAAFFE